MLIVVILTLSLCNRNGLGFRAACDNVRGHNVPGSRQHVLLGSTKDGASTTKTGDRSTIELAVQNLASTTLALLSGDAEAAASLVGGALRKKSIVQDVFSSYDVCGSGTLSQEETKTLFSDLARSMVVELSKGPRSGEDVDSEEVMAYQAHAKRVLADDEAGNTIDRVATKLLLMADKNRDGRINLSELANLFDEVFDANIKNNEGKPNDLFPQPLRALAGSLQLLPPAERSLSVEAASKSELYNVGVAGDDHTLRRVMLEGTGNCSNSLSLVGLGRSADASAYFIPELGIALDAGLHVSSLSPRTVCLTHGHRDHTGALPVHASHNSLMLVPRPIKNLVKNFLLAEAQLNYGDPSQTDDQTVEALGEFNLMGVEDGDRLILPKDRYTGSPTPIGIKVFEAPHKSGVPAVSYGVFRQKQRLKDTYRGMDKSEIGKILRSKRETGDKDVAITEQYDEGILFYTGDTTITLLREKWKSIVPHFRWIIHEVTFLGTPSTDLDTQVMNKGHCHYAQLHPWICAFPKTNFILVHWSLRYGREEVLEWFNKNYGGVPRNVVLWL